MTAVAVKDAARYSESDGLDVAVTILDHSVHVVVRDHGMGFVAVGPCLR